MAVAEPRLKTADRVRLLEIAQRGLERLYDPHTRRFAYQIQNERRLPIPLGQAIRYSAICLIGLSRVRHRGQIAGSVNESDALESLVHISAKTAGPGDLGLILWADAEYGGGHLPEVVKEVRAALAKRDLVSITTMELAWVLAGLCHAGRFLRRDRELNALVREIVREMTRRIAGAEGLFVHIRTGGSANRIRQYLATFADQIYPIYAFSLYSEQFDDPAAAQLASRCATTLCALQGEAGQWWWHYNARAGIVASRYPVYSVHQDGMAPMALAKLSSVTGEDFSQPIERGLNWLFACDEMNVGLVDWDEEIIWRGVEKARPAAYLRYLSLAMSGLRFHQAGRLLDLVPSYQITREMRPYHLGWLLYALATLPGASF